MDGAVQNISKSHRLSRRPLKIKVKVFNFLFPSFCQSPAGFTQVSEQSGGITFSAATLEAGDVVNIADRAIQANALEIFLIKVSNFGSTPYTHLELHAIRAWATRNRITCSTTKNHIYSI
jgi:hypothetical protein